MRTPEQILNLRKVMSFIFGPVAILMDDAEVNFWADAIQRKVNDEHRKFISDWEIKIRDITMEKDRSWISIPKEPKINKCSFGVMVKLCEQLILKYIPILSILIIDNKTNESFLVERGNPNVAMFGELKGDKNE